MSSAAANRFQELRRRYRDLVPSKNVSRKRRRELSWAAAIETTREVASIELALGRPHDRGFIDQLKDEVQAHLAAAGVRFKR